jgi:molybdopterin synthase sulfur carrier subunit
VINIKLLGKFSELPGIDKALTIPDDGIGCVADIYQYLEQALPELHRQITAPQVLVAVNQQFGKPDTPVGAGDEVAFLPPVTGG